MKNVKILIAIVIILVLVNCGMLALFWLRNADVDAVKAGPPRRAHEFLTRELSLTKAQSEAYKTMRESHFATTRKLNEANRELHDSLFANIKANTLDSVKVNALEQKIANNQIQLENTTLLHFRELREILTPAQQKKFDNVIQDALRMMGGPPRGGRPGPGGMPPPREGDKAFIQQNHAQLPDNKRMNRQYPTPSGENSEHPHKPEHGDGRGFPPPPPPPGYGQ